MANINRWDPLGEMMTLREAVNNLFEQSVVNPETGATRGLSMALDVAETPEAFVVEAVVPGVKSEDLDITLEDNVLTISGETRQEQTQGGKKHYHRVERRYGRFSRSVGLPVAVQSDKVQASLRNGILRIEIPKAEAVKPRKISVSAGNGSGQRQAIDVTPSEQQQGS